ncbi:hypothetical protein E2562_031745 [Oryza meyeriana var. granulata]|uniref:Uncharacterized protein n=1 Tax=Oryza meyeriana var. granulata TaxID=110450 RepID=A0A6G1CV79_9ORYZ|nr:hypothetical protein E2562_031745 [Oryza meyeriana var. granulata]
MLQQRLVLGRSAWLRAVLGCGTRKGGHGWLWAELCSDGLLRLGWPRIEQMVDDEHSKGHSIYGLNLQSICSDTNSVGP